MPENFETSQKHLLYESKEETNSENVNNSLNSIRKLKVSISREEL